MKALTILRVANLIAFLGGCGIDLNFGFVSSVNPLFTENEIIFNPHLLGEWSDGFQQLSITRKGENAYILSISEIEDETGYKTYFLTHLVKLDNETYLDIYPLDTLNTNLSDPTLIPVHHFWKIEIKQVEIILSLMDNALVDSLLNVSRVEIPYVESKDGWILLNASTEKLQNLIKENENLFIHPIIYRKVK